MEISMNNTTKGKQLRPPKLCFYGTHKIGKSTLANHAKKAFFLKLEDRLSHINCHSTPLIPNPDVLVEWLLYFLKLQRQKELEISTLIIDSMDALERSCWNHICEATGAASINDPFNKSVNFGHGYQLAHRWFTQILELLDKLNAGGMTIILVAHSQVSRFEDPSTASYDRWDLDLYDGKKFGVSRLICQWVDVIGFCYQQVEIEEEDKGWQQTKNKAKGNPRKRMIAFQPRPAYIAGNSYNLPDMEMKEDGNTWKKIATLIAKNMKEKGNGTNTGPDTGKGTEDIKSSGVSTAGPSELSVPTMPSVPPGGNHEPDNGGAGSTAIEAIPFEQKEIGGSKKEDNEAAS